MKFAEHLSAHVTPEWKKQYLNYEVSFYRHTAILSHRQEKQRTNDGKNIYLFLLKYFVCEWEFIQQLHVTVYECMTFQSKCISSFSPQKKCLDEFLFHMYGVFFRDDLEIYMVKRKTYDDNLSKNFSP